MAEPGLTRQTQDPRAFARHALSGDLGLREFESPSLHRVPPLNDKYLRYVGCAVVIGSPRHCPEFNPASFECFVDLGEYLILQLCAFSVFTGTLQAKNYPYRYFIKFETVFPAFVKIQCLDGSYCE